MSVVERINDSKIFSSFLPFTSTILPKNKILIRNFQLNDSQILFANNQDLKIQINNESFTLLKVNFTIEHMELNSKQDLLALYDSTHLIIVSLSELLPTKENIKIFNIDPQTKILKVLWNTLSKNESTLVVLNEDSKIRTFDILKSFDPVIYDLNDSRKFGLSNKISEPISMTFGHGLKGSLTLFVLDKGGDVFAIYPFVSDEICVNKEELEEYLNESILYSNNDDDDNNNSNNSNEKGLQQLKFAINLWKQVPLAQTEIRGIEELIVLNTNVKQFYIQGPFSVNPFPEEFYDDFGIDIISINDLIVVSFAKNGVCLFKVDELVMQSGNDFEEDPSLILVEYIKKQGICYISHIGDNLLIQNNEDVFEIDLKPLFDIFNKALDNPESIRDLKIYLKEVFKGGYVGHGIINGSELVLLKDEYKIDLGNKEADETIIEQNQEVSYETLITQNNNYKELLKQLKSFNLRLPRNSNIPLTEDSLIDTNNISEQILQRVIILHKLGLDLNYKIGNQKVEFTRQINKTNELINKSEEINKGKKSRFEQIDKVIEKQNLLNERFNNLTKKLNGDINLPLSKKDIQWFKEIQSTTYNFNSTVKRTALLKEQLAYLRTEIKSSNKDIDDWSDINEILKNGKQTIEETKLELEKNLKDLNTQMKDVSI